MLLTDRRHRSLAARWIVISIAVFLDVLTPAQAQEVSTSSAPISSREFAPNLQEQFGIRPQLGGLTYQNPDLSFSTRFAAGILVDWNLLRTVTLRRHPDEANSLRWFVGPASGFIFSYLSSPGTSLTLLPFNARAGFLLAQGLRLGLHAGANLILRSKADSVRLGDAPTGSGSDSSFYPNFGIDMENAIGTVTTLMIRPDWTITPGGDIFTMTAALSISLGT